MSTLFVLLLYMGLFCMVNGELELILTSLVNAAIAILNALTAALNAKEATLSAELQTALANATVAFINAVSIKSVNNI